MKKNNYINFKVIWFELQGILFILWPIYLHLTNWCKFTDVSFLFDVGFLVLVGSFLLTSKIKLIRRIGTIIIIFYFLESTFFFLGIMFCAGKDKIVFSLFIIIVINFILSLDKIFIFWLNDFKTTNNG